MATIQDRHQQLGGHAGSTSGMIRILETASEIDHPGPMHRVAARIDLAFGNYEAAVRHLRELLKIDPGHADLGVMPIHLGEFENAFQHFEPALDFDPEHSSAGRDLEHSRQKILPE